MKLEIKDLVVQVEGKDILKGVSLTIEKGQVHVLMGPNGSGKSTLANTLMGHPAYEVVSGSLLLDGEDITDLDPDKRARLGLFLSFQYPKEIEGVTLANFLRTAYNSLHEDNPKSMVEFHKYLKEQMALLHIDSAFSRRYLNKGFSGGEKKRAEILQMKVLDPKYMVLDETDSGLDVDALRVVSEGINTMRGPEKGLLLITHYQRILDYVTPDVISILKDGEIVKTGDASLARKIEEQGFDKVISGE